MVDNPSRTDKPSIAVLGAGRVGSTLAAALYSAGYPITAVWSRTEAHAQALAERVGARIAPLEIAPRAAVLTLIAVSDDSIEGLTTTLAAGGAWAEGSLVVHCSGTLPAAALAPAATHGARVGALHPLVAIAER
ncbi:MAG TPA: NAD(P)-binding domain-containing protein, partial [Herpetosiphonaceae bacterium]|nr:NAD(P)-binding domain-containing protein [Herpetosiphonaceae bacterium]